MANFRRPAKASVERLALKHGGDNDSEVDVDAQCRPEWKRVIGIVGGLGPHAHLELERLILDATRRRLGRPPHDQDYPEWVLSSIPGTPDRTLAFLGGVTSALPSLARSVRRIAASHDHPGADFAVIACNTAHLYLDELRRLSPIPILDMIAETVLAAGQQLRQGGRMGLLATTGTIQAGLYNDAMERLGHTCRVVSLLDCSDSDRRGDQLQEELVMTPIYGPLRDGARQGGGIKSGVWSVDQCNLLRTPFVEAIGILRNAGAELIVLGCTEIPLVLGREPVGGTPVIDPLAVAASAAVEIALGDRPLP